MTIEDAYAIQTTWMELKLAEGRVMRGRKVGLTSKAMQRAVHIEEPDFGVLMDDMFYPDSGAIPTRRFMQLRIEAELAFVLGRPLRGPACTLFDVLDATRYVVPALEILDARIERVDRESGRARTVLDTISDNAANAAVVLGGRPVGLTSCDVDLRRVGAIVLKNGQVEETGLAAAVLNHPAHAVAWLANRLHRHGLELESDSVILAGSFIRPIEVDEGDSIVADFGELGTVSCRFT